MNMSRRHAELNGGFNCYRHKEITVMIVRFTRQFEHLFLSLMGLLSSPALADSAGNEAGTAAKSTSSGDLENFLFP